MVAKQMFRVTTHLSIWTEPALTGQRLPNGLLPGAEIEVDPASRREANGYIWWRHADGWSAERRLDGTAIFMVAISAASNPKLNITEDPTRFTVIQYLSVRTQPGLSSPRLTSTLLRPGTIIEVNPGSRRELDGYIWWRHAEGWSAERKLDGSAIFLEAISTNLPKTPESPEEASSRRFSVLKPLSIRSAPSLSAQQLGNGLSVGQIIKVDANSRREAGGYIWWQHSQGWSAERNTLDTLVFLGEPQTASPHNPDGSINVDGLPHRDRLFQRLPVDFHRVQWVQYFGNTTFAYENGRERNYHTFSQGLHAGIDLGNTNPAGIPVYAGINGTFIRNSHFGIGVHSGEYVVIYRHLHNVLYHKDDIVTPDTVLGEMNTLNHLHLEVRYDLEQWIVNPLLLMPANIRDGIMTRFSDYNEHFQSWYEWRTPLDQPVLQLGGPTIGPTTA